jgi:hypothetical protein
MSSLRTLIALSLAAAGTLAAGLAHAHGGASWTHDASWHRPAAAHASELPRVDARQARQRHRIAQGVADGSLTVHEARGLRAQQRHIARVEHHARADGVVTPAERRHLHGLQDRASRHIAAQKRDALVRPHARHGRG